MTATPELICPDCQHLVDEHPASPHEGCCAGMKGGPDVCNCANTRMEARRAARDAEADDVIALPESANGQQCNALSPLWRAVEEAIHVTLVRITAPESAGVSLRRTAGLLAGTIASLVGAPEDRPASENVATELRPEPEWLTSLRNDMRAELSNLRLATPAVPCVWSCSTCNSCHTNACPSLWGGQPAIPCGHIEEKK